VEGPYYVGVQNLGDSSVVLRIIALVNENDRYNVARSLNREMKILFDKNNVSITYPQLVVHEAKKNEVKEKNSVFFIEYDIIFKNRSDLYEKASGKLVVWSIRWANCSN